MPPRSEKRSSSPTSLRDVDEDLERGRIYLPADELAAHTMSTVMC